jgi:hypothetical protein
MEKILAEVIVAGSGLEPVDWEGTMGQGRLGRVSRESKSPPCFLEYSPDIGLLSFLGRKSALAQAWAVLRWVYLASNAFPS